MTLGNNRSYQWSDKLRKFVEVSESTSDNLIPNKDLKKLEKAKPKDITSDQLDFLEAENATLKIKSSAASDQNNQLSAENQLLKSEVRRLKSELEKQQKLNYDKDQQQKLLSESVDKIRQSASNQIQKYEKDLEEKEAAEKLIQQLKDELEQVKRHGRNHSPKEASRTVIKFGSDKEVDRKLKEYPELKIQVKELEEKVKLLRKEKWERKQERRYEDDIERENEFKRMKLSEKELKNKLLVERSENEKLKSFIEKTTQ